jgi:hypothetical protein
MHSNAKSAVTTIEAVAAALLAFLASNEACYPRILRGNP